MKKIIFFSLVAILATNCNAQDSKTTKKSFDKVEKTQDSTNPKESWKVNKEVDENGNIIRYDSIYSWSSSSGNLKDLPTNESDSIFSQMQEMMRKRFSSFSSSGFDPFTRQDSIMKQFFNDDFFSGSINSDFPNMENIRKQMDSIKKHFFNRQPQYIIPPTKKKEEKNNSKKI